MNGGTPPQGWAPAPAPTLWIRAWIPAELDVGLKMEAEAELTAQAGSLAEVGRVTEVAVRSAAVWRPAEVGRLAEVAVRTADVAVARRLAEAAAGRHGLAEVDEDAGVVGELAPGSEGHHYAGDVVIGRIW